MDAAARRLFGTQRTREQRVDDLGERHGVGQQRAHRVHHRHFDPCRQRRSAPRTPSVTEPAPWVASYRKRRAKKVREPRVPNHAGYDQEVAALSWRSIVERLEGWTDDGYTKGGFDAGYVN